MGKHIDPRGLRFGRLVVLKLTQTDRRMWICRCDCGTEKAFRPDHIKSGATLSCGCATYLDRDGANETHGQSGTPEFIAWSSAKARCYNPNNRSFARYGGRGITMCERWRNDYAAFLADMGERPDGASLDRYPDCDGPYAPHNCRWATLQEQANNKATVVKVNVDGTMTPAHRAALANGIERQTVHARINKLGWDPARAISEPTHNTNRKRRLVQ